MQTILAEADAAGEVDWNVSVDATICRAHQHGTNTTRPEQDTGARLNHKNRPPQDCETAGHDIGRSRGGLTTKIHSAVDGRGRPLANVVTGGQRNDGAMLAEVLADIHVPAKVVAGLALAPTRSSPTRRTRPARSDGSSAVATSPRSSRRKATPSPPASAEAAAAAGHQNSTLTSTKAATSSSDPSHWPSNGEPWPPATTNSQPPTAPPSPSVQS